MSRFLKFLDKYFVFVIPAGLFIGLAMGSAVSFAAPAIPWIFAAVSFIGSLKMDFNAIKKIAKKPKAFLIAMAVLRIIMPLWAFLFGRILFPGDIYTQTGLLLFALLPVAINSAIWTMLYKGNVTLALSVILIDTVISPIAIPFSLYVLTGAQIEMDTVGMMLSLLKMIVIPSIIGMTLNVLSKGEVSKKWSPVLGPYTRLGMVLVILLNGSTLRSTFPPVNFRLLFIMLAIGFLAATGYFISFYLAKWLKVESEDAKTVIFSGGMRNMGTGLVIVIAHFPAAASIPLIAGIMIQQLVCGACAKFLERQFNRDHIELI